jgi:hypothetical protein
VNLRLPSWRRSGKSWLSTCFNTLLWVIVYPIALVLGFVLGIIIVAFSFLAAFVDNFLPDFLIAPEQEILSFFNRKELNVFDNYVRKLNEFGVGKFELKRFGRSVTILLDGAPVALYKHYDDKIYFPVLEDYCWVSDKKPSDSEFMSAILVGCLASPIFAKLKEQKKDKGELLMGGFYFFNSSQGGRKPFFQIFHLDSHSNLHYSVVLLPIEMDTDPESYLVHLLINLTAPYCSKIETNLPYKAVAQHGFPEEAKGLLFL